MIEQVGKSLQARTEAARAQGPKAGAPLAAVGTTTPVDQTQAPASPAAALAAEGAPIDAGKVAAIRAAIANGSYKVDPQAIAEKMIALDLPGAGAGA